MISEDNEDNEYDKIISPYTYLQTQTHGKGFRNKLIKIFNLYYQVNEENLKVVEEFIDILHNSSLIIDDVEDDGEIRRGIKCAHKIFGIAQTINAGNLMYFKALKKLMEIKINDNNNNNNNNNNLIEFEIKNKLNLIFIESMIKLHIGQGKEIYWRNFEKCPNEKEYMEMIIEKTGELFQLGVYILEILSLNEIKIEIKNEINKKIKEYCKILGMIYQIKNDIKDLIDEDAHDLKEGKYSLPIIYCIKNKNKTKILKHNNKDNKDNQIDKEEWKSGVIKEIEELGGISYAKDKMKELVKEGIRVSCEITELGNSQREPCVVEMGCMMERNLAEIT